MGNVARIAFVITELEVGGAERCLVNLATRIDCARFELLVISIAPRPAESKAALVEQLERAHIPVRFLNRRSVWQIQSGYAQLTHILRGFRPQIVQTFLFHANVLGAAAARRAGAPHVLAGIRVADPRRWRAWLERWACRRVERFVCVSERVAEHCRAWGYPADKLTVIHNGIDWRRYAEAVPIALPQLGLPAGRRAIVFVGRLDPQKGLDDFLEMCPVIFRELPDHDLVLVGDGPRRHELACRARHLDIASRVHFTGWRSDVPEILAAAEMLVLPSRWEGMPNVVLEAMAAGKPVVATRVAGVEEALGELAEVQCVVPGDQRGFAGRICHFVRHPQEAQKVGQNNQRRVAEAFSVDAVADSYQALYWAILTSQAGGTFSD